MNPLDPLELQSFNERLLDMMPQQTETTLKIPKVMYGNFPKNLKEFSNERFEKTLNKYQGIIEEILHRDKNNQYGKSFKQYTRKYFNEVIGHDSNSFFKNTILPDLSDIRQIGRQHNNPKISFLSKVNGSTLTSGGTSSNTNVGTGTLQVQKTASDGTIGQYYDQTALDVTSGGSGNYHQGVYDDNGSTIPNNLLADTGSIAVTANFAVKSVTEFSLTTAKVWLAWQADNTAPFVNNDISSTNTYEPSHIYGALPNPIGSVGGSNSRVYHMQVSHS